MFLMLVVGYLSLINVFTSKMQLLKVLYLFICLQKWFEKKYFRGKKLQTCKDTYDKRN